MRLPIFEAFGETFAFLFGHLFDVIRIVWLPLALLLGIAILIMPGYSDALSQVTALGPYPDPRLAMQTIGPTVWWIGAAFLAATVLFTIIYTGLLKLVIRGEKPALPFYLQFGGDELRAFVTFLLVALLLFVTNYVGTVIVFGVFAGAAGKLSEEAAGVVAIVGGIALWFFFTWLGSRLYFSLPAAVGAKTIGIGPSWSMTKHNVISLIIYNVLWLVIFFAAQVAFFSLAMPADMQQMMSGSGDPLTILSQFQGSMQPLIWIGSSYAFVLVLCALLIISSGVAYRLITNEDAAHA